MSKLALPLVVVLIGVLACAPPTTSYNELAQKHEGAFVGIHDTVHNTYGSGFVVEYQGKLFVVTAAHAYKSTEHPIFITMESGPIYYVAEHAVRSPAINPERDIAVIPWEPYFDAPTTPLRIRSDNITQGESVALTCNPFRFEEPIREGVYAREEISEDFSFLGKLLRVYTYENLDPRGCSGSAVIDLHGNVVGVFVLYQRDDHAALWITPIEHVVSLIDQV